MQTRTRVIDMPPEPQIDAVSGKMEIKEISPTIASALLKRNPANRPLKDRRVALYASIMQKGQWRVNGQGIILDEAGDVLDGQHRLAAVIRYGKPVRMAVITNIQRAAMETIDVGAKRTLGDSLGIRGAKDANLLASSVQMLYGHEFGDTELRMATFEDFEAYLEKYPILRNATGKGRRLDIARGMNATSATVAYALTALAKQTAADLFFEGLVTGANLPESDPRLAFTRWLFNFSNKAEGKLRGSRKLQLWAYLKTWNAWATGDEMRAIRFADGEQRPKIFIPKDF